MSRGQYRYDFGDTTKLTPLIKMYTLGHSFMPPGIHAGGLRYHGMAPMVSLAREAGPDRGRWRSTRSSASRPPSCSPPPRAPFPPPRPRTPSAAPIVRGHPLPETGEEKCILFNFSGHGLCDMASYDKFFAGPLGRLRLSAGEDSRGIGRTARAGVKRGGDRGIGDRPATRPSP